MGANNGSGRPNYFCCSKCRIQNSRQDFLPGHFVRTGYKVTLTGKKRALNDGRAGIRNSTHARQYTCDDCGHVGWSRHFQLEHQEEREAKRAEEGMLHYKITHT